MRQGTLWSEVVARCPALGGASGRYLLGLTALCLLIRLLLAAMVYGSDDVSSWYYAADAMLRRYNPYRLGLLNWPPLWPLLIYVSALSAMAYHVPLPFTVKLAPILADTAITAALYAWFRRNDAPVGAAHRALWYALNPVAIYTSALHGQFDAIPTLFTLLAVLSAANAEDSRDWTRTSLWLGLGGLAKTWPLVLIPSFLPEVRTWPGRVVFAAVAAAPAVISVGLLYLVDPEPIARHVLAYRGYTGWWGVTSFLAVTPGHALPAVMTGLSLLFYAALASAYWHTWRGHDVVKRALLVLLTFYVFTPGFGLQYLIWVIPVALVADYRNAIRYSLLAGVVIAVVTLLRPYTGELGFFYTPPAVRTAAFNAAYGKPRDQLITCALELPLWGFCVLWWLRTWKDALRSKGRLPAA